MKYLILFVGASMIFGCSVSKKATDTAQSGGIVTASKTAPTLSSLDTKVTMLTAANTTQDNKINSLTNSLSSANSKIITITNSVAVLTAANSAKDKSIKALQDSIVVLNKYKGILDKVIFKNPTGVITIPLLYQIAEALKIKIQ